jgi:hypothetical protein
VQLTRGRDRSFGAGAGSIPFDVLRIFRDLGYESAEVHFVIDGRPAVTLFAASSAQDNQPNVLFIMGDGIGLFFQWSIYHRGIVWSWKRRTSTGSPTGARSSWRTTPIRTKIGVANQSLDFGVAREAPFR